MYAAVLGILSCIGAWIAWRRHPIYTSTATLRVIGEVFLLMIAAVCVIAVTVLSIQRFPLPVQIAALFAVVVFVTLGMIFSITALSTPKSAKLNTVLPPSVPELKWRRRGVVHWMKVAAIFAVICGLFCAIPGPTRYIAASVLGLTALLSSVMIPTAYVMARRFDRAATGMQLHSWQHWHYQPQEWQAWSQVRVERLAAQPEVFKVKRDWRRLLSIAGGLVISALIITPGGWLARLGWAACCFALILGWVEYANWDARRAPEKLRALLARAAPEVYFGDDGLICDDRLITWLGADVYLTNASLDERTPRSLLMNFEKVVPNPYGTVQIVPISQNVLIPACADPGDLAALRTALAARCPKATVSF